jgi:hypothetical protein
MIKITDGIKNTECYVEIKISPSNWQFYWWLEVSYWDIKDKCYIHYCQKDTGCFFFWNAVKKAEKIASEVFYELLEENRR